MITNHWGVTVDSKKPVTGVFMVNKLTEIGFDKLSYNSLDVDCMCCKEGDCDCCNIEHELLIGFKECRKKYSVFTNINVNYDKKAECSAIVRESYIQVLRSKYVIKGALCSPCFPGQVDGDSVGDFLGYSLPPELYSDKTVTKRIKKKRG